MTEVYTRLAQRLDSMPNGFPSTESGVELKILQKIFTPEEAETALKLQPTGETAEALSERLCISAQETQSMLDAMVKKGQLFSFKLFDQQWYVLPPFVPGILEFQLDRLDKELAELIDCYRPTLLRSLGTTEPPLFRVLPVHTAIDAGLHVYPYENIRLMMEEATAFNVMDCICRKEHALRGVSCRHSSEVCLGFSRQPNMFATFPLGRRITRQEALDILRIAEKEGLVHNTFNVQQEPIFICNCCPCCCGILQGVKHAHLPHLLAKSSFVATIDRQTCIQCGLCADERCPMDAIEKYHDGYKVVPERCIGCGLCTTTCPSGSATLMQKPPSEHARPPAHIVDWNLARAAARGIET